MSTYFTHHGISYFRQQPRIKILWRHRSYKPGSMTKRKTLLETQSMWGGLGLSVRSSRSFSTFLSCVACKKKKREAGACRVLCYFMEILRVTTSSGKSSSPLFSLPSFTFLPSPSLSSLSMSLLYPPAFTLQRNNFTLFSVSILIYDDEFHQRCFHIFHLSILIRLSVLTPEQRLWDVCLCVCDWISVVEVTRSVSSSKSTVKKYSVTCERVFCPASSGPAENSTWVNVLQYTVNNIHVNMSFMFNWYWFIFTLRYFQTCTQILFV